MINTDTHIDLIRFSIKTYNKIELRLLMLDYIEEYQSVYWSKSKQSRESLYKEIKKWNTYKDTLRIIYSNFISEEDEETIDKNPDYYKKENINKIKKDYKNSLFNKDIERVRNVVYAFKLRGKNKSGVNAFTVNSNIRYEEQIFHTRETKYQESKEYTKNVQVFHNSFKFIGLKKYNQYDSKKYNVMYTLLKFLKKRGYDIKIKHIDIAIDIPMSNKHTFIAAPYNKTPNPYMTSYDNQQIHKIYKNIDETIKYNVIHNKNYIRELALKSNITFIEKTDLIEKLTQIEKYTRKLDTQEQVILSKFNSNSTKKKRKKFIYDTFGVDKKIRKKISVLFNREKYLRMLEKYEKELKAIVLKDYEPKTNQDKTNKKSIYELYKEHLEYRKVLNKHYNKIKIREFRAELHESIEEFKIYGYKLYEINSIYNNMINTPMHRKFLEIDTYKKEKAYELYLKITKVKNNIKTLLDNIREARNNLDSFKKNLNEYKIQEKSIRLNNHIERYNKSKNIKDKFRLRYLNQLIDKYGGYLYWKDYNHKNIYAEDILHLLRERKTNKYKICLFFHLEDEIGFYIEEKEKTNENKIFFHRENIKTIRNIKRLRKKINIIKDLLKHKHRKYELIIKILSNSKIQYKKYKNNKTLLIQNLKELITNTKLELIQEKANNLKYKSLTQKSYYYNKTLKENIPYQDTYLMRFEVSIKLDNKRAIEEQILNRLSKYRIITIENKEIQKIKSRNIKNRIEALKNKSEQIRPLQRKRRIRAKNKNYIMTKNQYNNSNIIYEEDINMLNSSSIEYKIHTADINKRKYILDMFTNKIKYTNEDDEKLLEEWKGIDYKHELLNEDMNRRDNQVKEMIKQNNYYWLGNKEKTIPEFQNSEILAPIEKATKGQIGYIAWYKSSRYRTIIKILDYYNYDKNDYNKLSTKDLIEYLYKYFKEKDKEVSDSTIIKWIRKLNNMIERRIITHSKNVYKLKKPRKDPETYIIKSTKNKTTIRLYQHNIIMQNPMFMFLNNLKNFYITENTGEQNQYESLFKFIHDNYNSIYDHEEMINIIFKPLYKLYKQSKALDKHNSTRNKPYKVDMSKLTIEDIQHKSINE